MLVFYDKRYRSVLTLPPGSYRVSFDRQEIESRGGNPSAERHRRALEEFCEAVRMRRGYQVEVGQRTERVSAGLLLPPEDYDDETLEALTQALAERGYLPTVIPWPFSAGGRAAELAATCDWIALDPGDLPEGAAALGWLDGRGVPLVRLRRQRPGRPHTSPAEDALYRNFEVGYTEDGIWWRDRDDLLSKVGATLDLLLAPSRRISTAVEALEYFRSAGRRPEKVFLSFASEDAVIASHLYEHLARTFHTVFNYQQKEALTTGISYPEQVYDRLAEADIGVALLSTPYLSKETCRHEAQDMAASRDAGTMFVYPLNVDGCQPPSYFRSMQFEQVGPDDFDGALNVDRLVRAYDEWQATRT